MRRLTIDPDVLESALVWFVEDRHIELSKTELILRSVATGRSLDGHTL